MWEYGLVIRGRWKYIYVVGDILWVVIVIIYGELG